MSKLVNFVDSIVDNRGKNPPYYSVNYEYPVIDNFLINGDRYPNINRVKRFIDKNVFNTFIRKYLKKDDVVITLVGNGVGSCCLVPADNWVIIQNTIGLKTKPSVYNRYLYYYLKLNKNKIALLDGGSSQPNVRVDNFLQIKVNFQNFDEQKKIAETLYILDSKIELNKRINAELEAMAKTLYDYWFVQFDFPDKNGKPYKTGGGKMVWNEELKREIPERWEVKPLSEITQVSNESVNPMDFPDKEFKYYSIPGFDESGTFKIEKGFEIKSNKYSIKNTDVLVSKLNPWFSRVIYATDDSDLISSTEFVVWRTKNLAMKNYMYMIARDASFVTFCTKSASGTSNSHKRVNPTVMMKYKIVFDETVTTHFGNTLGSSIKMLEKNKIENQKLTELRDWLLPMLMNGQVKVN